MSTKKVKELSRNVHYIDVDCYKQKEHWFLLSSDQHWDNPDSNRDLFEKHLREAQERDAKVFIFGDFFCAMQGKYDKRADKAKVRPEHQTSMYLDSLVDTAANWLMPYRDVIAVIGLGNHETAILKRHETNLIDRLVERLNIGQKEKVYMGGYGGWLRLCFSRTSTAYKCLNIKYFHGSGGGGPVTKGVIQSQRQAVYLPDADIVVSGHVHEQYLVAYTQERISQKGRVYLTDQWHVRTPTYKDEYKDGSSGWHIETGKPPKPIGAWWLKVTYDREQIKNKEYIHLHYDFIKAK
jgi:UDP-2,3-diacylglucosamine pyrophosphatase LpxH